MQTFAAIDIGSNSCRLKIARVVQHQLKVLHEDREVTRLGASVFESGLVSPDAMAATLRALKRFYRAVQMHSADKVRAVATAAMRDARNGRAFLAWVKDETGWEVEIISGLEEGRLIHRGVMSNEPGTAGRCLLIDVGGGSCEISLSDHRRLVETISVPLGAVRLTQEFLQTDPPTPNEVARLKQFIARELRRAERRVQPAGVKLVLATSGTAAALAEAGRVLQKRTAGVEITSTVAVRKLADKLTKLTNVERSGVQGIGPRRSEIIVAGAHVFAELLERFSLTGYRYSSMGLRDGILAQMLAETDPRTTAHQQFERDRWNAVLETCRRYGVEPRQAEPVRQHAEQLFHDLATIHQLPEEYQTMLEAAAMLRDVGKFMNYQGHHRHAQYIIANSELFGFTPQQRAVTSAIARYLGKSRPEPAGRTMRQVAPGEHEHVRRAVVLLRLAVALNQDRASDVLKVRVKVYPKRVMLELVPGRTGAELEIWSLRKEASYFREVFRRELFVTLV
ncbi:Ppx/GppA phosphatase family protein [Acidipila rosea]|uniref:Exopolyphosphatase/guanosine-5'-triphosphate, 3'-diphosphate pyrophosphatase n=1 Tax=Acidipila rosea TaxID=768535 RepID=A0A4R1LFB0_9BACT|nr:Ppx/GppA phosphatase family protein [Acidipila rosea]TCK75359.1 exopolyphosphatase/guanosine-5'-triphosphate,3'-diphosphate pyrophosphatase [Acidipila rosea]